LTIKPLSWCVIQGNKKGERLLKILVNLIGTLIGLILIALLTLLLLAPNAAIDFLRQLEQVDFPLRVGLVVLIFLLALIIFSIRVRLTPRGKSDALTVRTSDTISSVTVESVRELVLKTVGAVPGVATVDANVNSIGGRADIHLNVTTADDRLNIPEKQREISRVLDQVIKKQLGLQMLGRPKVNIQLGTRGTVAKPLPSPVMSEPVRPAPPPPVYNEPITPARDTTPPAVVPPPPASSLVTPTPAVIVPPPVEVVEEQPETQEESRGLFGGFGLGNSERIEEPSASEVNPVDEDDESDKAFYAMLEEERVSDTPASTIVIEDEPKRSDEDQDKDRTF
jgi:hypothetical protein